MAAVYEWMPLSEHINFTYTFEKHNIVFHFMFLLYLLLSIYIISSILLS